MASMRLPKTRPCPVVDYMQTMGPTIELWKGKDIVTSFNLDVGWVQHDSNRSTEGLWWQVLLEFGSDNTVVTVSSGHLTPDNSDLGASDLLGSSVDVSDSLTQVELSVLWVLNTFDLDQRDVWVGDVLRTLVGDVLTLNVHCKVSICQNLSGLN
ncbi:hypothetical protein EJF18_11106 [Clavispora lusitaniae]|uniref:Uncharacterized protein n=1 Tax=Clavispora lusitaniae TaxID=36911 RepID=A0ACD0WEP0_CLALS|nr:hypothetical protein FOB63_001015 [Clavispora lusitaniae]QFZ25982.1 hypothetical protein EJF14_11106 [Clavispora lusitaniae]QFZ30715.1 hypothetical protein EJF16_11106 [Clavispora lusitaniae]QFZ36383.1 hypothetical protein EJF15_11106 [Clavispora lusitaniae]QFZ42067.1 hypothetical protein EJF18_11106 [Clavispora lusitaniae]